MNAPEQARAVFLEAKAILDSYLSDSANFDALAKAAGLVAEAMKSGGKVISCGNGGSMCDAMHFAEELSGRFRDDRRALPAVSISDPSHLTCTANDYGFDQVFSRYVEAVGKEGDVLLAISTSGNSKNILRAIEAAREKKMLVVGLTGRDGGQMAGRCDVELRAPQSRYADRAQEIHIKMIHTLIQLIEAQV
jgi:D-sedoheptulose 7-phosphate isomerase